MPTSEDEWRQLRELEAQLVSHRRLVALARRLESASVESAPRQISALWMVTGGISALALVVAGAVVPNSVLVAAGVVILAATLVAVGAASLVMEATGYRREQPSAHGRRPES
jgi:hypothetical protein